jgi:hypothetical protein
MRQITKKISELSAWDLDKGCRRIIDQSTSARRRLKKIIRRQDRKRIDKVLSSWYN